MCPATISSLNRGKKCFYRQGGREEVRVINICNDFHCLNPEVRNFKRRQESKKKERKHALDQESDQERVFFLFLLTVIVVSFISRSKACFLFLFYSLVFFYKIPPQDFAHL